MSARQFFGFAGRQSHRESGTLGIISSNAKEIQKTYRKAGLDKLDAYYEGRQYSGKPSWDDSCSEDGDYVPVRKRAPRLNYNFAKILSSRLTAKLLGKKNFPTIKIEDDPDTTEYLRLITNTSDLRSKLMEPMRRTINSGSCLVRFAIVNGKWKIEHFLAKWCFPEFDETGELQKVEIKYVFPDFDDLDEKGDPKKKWFKLVLGKEKDVQYDSPVFEADNDPKFKVVQTANHGLGFVQAEWFVVNEKKNSIDGEPILADIMGFIDELNYSLSQTSTAIQYNQDPQLVFSGMDEEEVENVVKSSFKSWALGREGEAKFLEADMKGVETAIVFRDKVKLSIQDISRIVMLDPEKMATHAQSGVAMEILHGPMVELIEEMQPQFEKHLKNLIIKMALINGFMSELGATVPITLPKGFKPKSFNVIMAFPPVFPRTMQDIQQKVSVAVQAANASLISRESITKWLAKEFDIEDVEAEVERVNNQKILNPFGSF